LEDSAITGKSGYSWIAVLAGARELSDALALSTGLPPAQRSREVLVPIYVTKHVSFASVCALVSLALVNTAMAGLLVALLLPYSYSWPRIGVNDGDNKVVWVPGCCEGDQVTITFRDEMGDGNQGEGYVKLYNSSDNTFNTYRIGPFWNMWHTAGPFCAPAGEHELTFTSDTNSGETTVRVHDSFGLVKAMGGMDDFPLKFKTTAPAKFCTDDLTYELEKERAKKLVRSARTNAVHIYMPCALHMMHACDTVTEHRHPSVAT
jgi:hypothetical protein